MNRDLDGQDMSPIRDPEMKLFGAKIPLPGTQIPVESQHESDSLDQKDVCREETHDPIEVSIPGVKEEPATPNSSSGVKSGKDGNQASIEDNRSAVDPTHEEKQMETSATRGEQKVLKKTDNILSCPRCNSMDTKFCYYNNYNVNQPRHFCRNCQRYWTAGGATRNVPVGAGRRKHKHSASHYRHIVMSSDGLPTAHGETPCRLSGSIVPMNGIGTVIKFCPDMPLCEPMETILNVGDGKKNIDKGSFASGGKGDEPSSGSTVKASTCFEDKLPKKAGLIEQGAKTVSCSGFPPVHHDLQCYPGPPWTYPWSTWCNNVSAIAAGRCSSELIYEPENGNPGSVQWNPLPMVAAPAFCAPRITFPFVPASYWGSIPGGSHGMPVAQSNCSMPPSSSTGNNACSGNGSLTLGKHSRNATLLDEDKTDKCLWVPKTLRIDDPDEAAKSSIWATLGIKLDPNEPTTQGCIFKALQPNVEGKGHFLNAKQVLQANPAALSRSQMFQESV